MLLQSELTSVPYQYRTEREVAQLMFNMLHNPDSSCQFVAYQYKTEPLPPAKGEEFFTGR